MIAGIALGGDAEHSLAPGGGVEDVAFDVAEALEQLFAMTGEPGAESVRNHSAAGSLEERGVEAPLQVRELMTQRGLREVQLLTGSREGAELGDGHDEPKVTDLETHAENYRTVGPVSPMHSSPSIHRIHSCLVTNGESSGSSVHGSMQEAALDEWRVRAQNGL